MIFTKLPNLSKSLKLRPNLFLSFYCTADVARVSPVDIFDFFSPPQLPPGGLVSF